MRMKNQWIPTYNGHWTSTKGGLVANKIDETEDDRKEEAIQEVCTYGHGIDGTPLTARSGFYGVGRPGEGLPTPIPEDSKLRRKQIAQERQMRTLYAIDAKASSMTNKQLRSGKRGRPPKAKQTPNDIVTDGEREEFLRELDAEIARQEEYGNARDYE